jgi:hypothetical protein
MTAEKARSLLEDLRSPDITVDDEIVGYIFGNAEIESSA